MKKLSLTVFTVICALCMAFAVSLMTNTNKANAETVDGVTPVLSETKYKISTDKNGMLIATGIKNYEDVYEVGYTFSGDVTAVNNSTTKYYTSITSGTNKWTVEELFEGYTGMIVWEVEYNPAVEYSYKAYAKVGDRVDGNLVETDKKVEGTEKSVDIVSYTVNYKSEDGNTLYFSGELDHGEELNAYIVPKKADANGIYEFDGWTTAAGGGEKITTACGENVYASFKADPLYDTDVSGMDAIVFADQAGDTYRHALLKIAVPGGTSAGDAFDVSFKVKTLGVKNGDTASSMGLNIPMSVSAPYYQSQAGTAGTFNSDAYDTWQTVSFDAVKATTYAQLYAQWADYSAGDLAYLESDADMPADDDLGIYVFIYALPLKGVVLFDDITVSASAKKAYVATAAEQNALLKIDDIASPVAGDLYDITYTVKLDRGANYAQFRMIDQTVNTATLIAGTTATYFYGSTVSGSSLTSGITVTTRAAVITGEAAKANMNGWAGSCANSASIADGDLGLYLGLFCLPQNGTIVSVQLTSVEKVVYEFDTTGADYVYKNTSGATQWSSIKLDTAIAADTKVNVTFKVKTDIDGIYTTLFAPNGSSVSEPKNEDTGVIGIFGRGFGGFDDWVNVSYTAVYVTTGQVAYDRITAWSGDASGTIIADRSAVGLYIMIPNHGSGKTVAIKDVNIETVGLDTTGAEYVYTNNVANTWGAVKLETELAENTEVTVSFKVKTDILGTFTGIGYVAANDLFGTAQWMTLKNCTDWTEVSFTAKVTTGATAKIVTQTWGDGATYYSTLPIEDADTGVFLIIINQNSGETIAIKDVSIVSPG